MLDKIVPIPGARLAVPDYSARRLMEIKIGIRHIAREIVVETSEAKEILMEKVSKAIEDGSLLQIMDDKGNTTLISGAQIGYVELGSDAKRHVGFGIGA